MYYQRELSLSWQSLAAGIASGNMKCRSSLAFLIVVSMLRYTPQKSRSNIQTIMGLTSFPVPGRGGCGDVGGGGICGEALRPGGNKRLRI